MENEKNKNVFGVIIACFVSTIAIGFILFFVISNYFNEPKKVEYKDLNGGTINLSYTDDENVLSISNLRLIDDEEGIKLESSALYFDFTVSVSLDDAKKIDYDIVLTPTKNNTVSTENVKFYLEKMNNGSYASVVDPVFFTKEKDIKSDKFVLYSDSTPKSSNDNYRLRMWVPNESNYSIKEDDVISFKITLEGKAS